MGKNLFQKVWDRHAAQTLPNGQTQVFIGLHLIHEVTSPQAFGMLRDPASASLTPSARSRRSITSSRPTRASARFATTSPKA
jgi:homoaconitase/3-isopropylmalate dehydratase large subunit